jgi:hypothetical protein
MPALSRKLHPFALTSAVSGSAPTSTAAPTKTVPSADGSGSITLTALPVLPPSPFRPVDSRSNIECSYDAASLIAVTRAKRRKLPLDVEHGTESYSGDKRARGWCEDLTTAEFEPDAGLEPGVLYAWFDLNELGTQELADKLYAYTSAVALGVWLDENKLMFTRIKSLALTNNPATEMPALFSAQSGIDEAEFDAQAAQLVLSRYTSHQHETEAEMLAKILSQLGLAADASEAAVLSAIAALSAAGTGNGTPATAGFTAALSAAGVTDEATFTAFSAQLAAANTQVTALTAELATLKANEAEAMALSAVDAAIAARKITPAQRDSMLAMARLDVAKFTAAMGGAAPVISDEPTQAPAPADKTSLSAEDAEFLQAYGFKPESLAQARAQLSAQ